MMNGLLSEEQLDELLESALPVLVLFTAEYSATAKRMVPVVEGLVRSLGDDVYGAVVDVDGASWGKERFGVESVPTALLLRGEKVIMRTAGEKTLDELTVRVAAALAE
ncbi:hypothetical protein GCM10027589_31840 [Actinocorallia lasiicapitis]